ncbi:MAG: hypothetical protein ACRDT4_21000 [Micromonosporaceae bacterium]
MNADAGWGRGTEADLDAAVERFLANPGLVTERLAADQEQVAALGRTGVKVSPGLRGDELAAAVVAQAEQLDFGSPVLAATAVAEQFSQLPLAERQSGAPIAAYHHSASATVAGGTMVGEWPTLEPGSELVFQRRAVEAGGTGVLLEAVVQVAPDGTALLQSYGWPVASVTAPVFRFDGLVGGYVSQLRDDLRGTADMAPGEEQFALFRRAMLMAYGVGVSGRGGAAAELVDPAREEFLGLVVPQTALLVEYLDGGFGLAGRGGLHPWLEACVRRSAAEALFGHFLGGAAYELVDAEALDELTAAITAAGTDLPAEQRRLLTPAGTPSNHTWWS